MLKSLVNLPMVISDLCRAPRSEKKRRQVNRGKSSFAAIEELEFRQLLSAMNGSSAQDFTPRIINGTTTTDFDAVAQLSFTQTSSSSPLLSTGTFISEDWVLTSASASKGLTEDGLTAAGGSATVIVDGTTYTVDDIVPYGKYAVGAGDYTQDIALWHITLGVGQSLPAITPLAISRTPGAAKHSVTLVGYGLPGTVSAGASGTYGTLREGTTTIDRVTSSQLSWKLTGTESTSASGDTGGPVLVENSTTHEFSIVGVASTHSTTTSKKNDIAFNTRVDVYAGWIDDVLGEDHPAVTGTDDYANDITTTKVFTYTNKITSLDVTGKLGTYGDVDVFKLVTPADGVATFNLVNSSPASFLLDTKLEILDSEGTLISTFSSDDIGRTNLNSQLVKTLTAGTYYIKVSGYSDTQLGTYRLTMKEKYSGTVTPPTPVTPADVTGVGQIVFTPATGPSIYSTGTVIGANWVLTTASASKGLAGGTTADFIIGGVTYHADGIHVYPKYNATSSGDYRQDIALWHFTTPIASTIVPLAVSSTPVAAGATVTLAGYGGTALGSSGVTFDTLQTITRKVERVSQSQLAWKLANALELTTAAGDTGGAVLKLVGSTYQIVGLATTNVTTASKVGQTALNTRTDLYLAWIDGWLDVTPPVLSATDDNADLPDVFATVNKTSTLTVAKPTVQVSGKLENYGDEDVFKLVVAADGIVQINAASSSPGVQFLDTTVTLLDSDGVTVLGTSDDIVVTSDLGSQLTNFLEAGTYYVVVGGYAGQQVGTYRLTLAGNFDGTNNTTGTATTLTPNSIGTATANVSINALADVDYFKFTANKTGKFQFDLENADGGTLLNPAIEVFEADGTTSLGSNDDISLTNHNARVVVTTITSGQVYYVKVSGSLDSSVGLGKLTIKKIL